MKKKKNIDRLIKKQKRNIAENIKNNSSIKEIMNV